MKKIINEVSQNIIGSEKATLLMMVSLFAKGHILIEDVPGVGKTLLASSLAKLCNIDFARVQCTSDLLPSDILGFNMYQSNSTKAEYIKGPVMTNFLLVDEINRATPKTQSALLEVMEEQKISLDGKTMDVPQPFMVIATQNPIEDTGTFPLPQAQLDRFCMKISLGYPSFEDEISILSLYKTPKNVPEIQALLDKNAIENIHKNVENVEVDPAVMKYIVNIVSKTRSHPSVSLGCSPRSSLALLKCSQALAYINKRKYVIPDDVKNLAINVLSHRIILKTRANGVSHTEQSQKIVQEILATTEI